jgi:hypothetical protein
MTVLFLFILLIILPAALALLETSNVLSPVVTSAFDVGAPIVYSRQGMSTRPVSNAHYISPSERGEFYYYTLINYLRVAEVLDDGRVIAVARDNKRLCFLPNDSHFRKARITERLRYRRQFPTF